MQGKRIAIRRGGQAVTKTAPHQKLPPPPDYEAGPDGLAVYRVMQPTMINGHPYKGNTTVILPYTEEFYKRADLLLLRAIEP